jgi:hypothetical protein
MFHSKGVWVYLVIIEDEYILLFCFTLRPDLFRWIMIPTLTFSNLVSLTVAIK